MRNALLISTLCVVTALGISSARAQHAEVGKLSCDVSAGMGVIVGSKQDVSCVFQPSNNGPQEHYIGNITQFGLDVGVVGKGEMTWLVFASTDKVKDALAGTYRGATADATAGVGGAINVLVGGSKDSLSLQPVSVEGDTGINVAVGVEALTLRPAA